VTEPTPLLDVESLTVHYDVKGAGRFAPARMCAVSGVGFQVQRGETVGLVGESGCGKSTVGLAIQGLIPVTSGRIAIDGTDLLSLQGRRERQQLRRRMQLVFQDPTASLNPRMTVEDLLLEPLQVHGMLEPRQRGTRVDWLLDAVGLPTATAQRFPHEMSGGQRQRVALARALSVGPELIICDEPVTALDVSIRAQILNLLTDLQEQLGVSYVFISHDLAAVWHTAHTVLVMYLGRPMELTTRDHIFEHPAHPYTQALLAAVPVLDPDAPSAGVDIVEGEVPSPLNPPSGCVFRTRCPIAQTLCATDVPTWRDIGVGDDKHWVACHFAERTDPTPAKENAHDGADARPSDPAGQSQPDTPVSGPREVHPH
jgi:oligopeptide transport system ATP-binding protein